MMKKSLIILVGFTLILLLASLAFSNVSNQIQDDLLKKTEKKFYEKGINDIQAQVEGKGFGLSRNIILTGSVYSEKQKMYVASMVDDIFGVSSVKNDINVISPSYYKSIIVHNEQIEKASLQTRHSEVEIDVVQAVGEFSQKLPKVVKPQQVIVSEKPLQPQKAIEAVKSIEVSSEALPKVVQPMDVSTIKVMTPVQATVEVPKAMDVSTIYKENKRSNEGEE
jgi:hypothetical protein